MLLLAYDQLMQVPLTKFIIKNIHVSNILGLDNKQKIELILRTVNGYYYENFPNEKILLEKCFFGIDQINDINHIPYVQLDINIIDYLIDREREKYTRNKFTSQYSLINKFLPQVRFSFSNSVLESQMDLVIECFRVTINFRFFIRLSEFFYKTIMANFNSRMSETPHEINSI